MKVKGIIFSFLIAMFGICIMPFSVYAEEDVTITTSNILGVFSNSASSNRTTSIGIAMDSYYIGTLTIKVNYIPISGSSGSQNVEFYINGVYGYGDLSISGPILSISKGAIVSQNLKIVRDDWQFPIESLTFVEYMSSKNYTQVGIKNLGDYVFPVYSLVNGNMITQNYSSTQDMSKNNIIYIIGVNDLIYDQNTLNTDFYMTNGNNHGTLHFEFIETLYRSDMGYKFSVFKAQCYMDGYDGVARAELGVNKNLDIMPIYCGYDSRNNISTDFALQFNLNNRLLDALENIAPNQQSDQSADNLEDLAYDFTLTSNDVVNIENTVGTGFTNALQNIPTNYDFQTNFGDKFIHSAQWVRNQFNTMTVGNPFGSLITYSLILGVALLLLGRRLL